MADEESRNGFARRMAVALAVLFLATLAIPAASASDYRCWECDYIVDNVCRAVGVGHEAIDKVKESGPVWDHDPVPETVPDVDVKACATGHSAVNVVEYGVNQALSAIGSVKFSTNPLG